MTSAEVQVHITKDGFDIQTTMQTYQDYYKRIGWKFAGLPANLPGIDVPVVTQTQIADLAATQASLL